MAARRRIPRGRSILWFGSLGSGAGVHTLGLADGGNDLPGIRPWSRPHTSAPSWAFRSSWLDVAATNRCGACILTCRGSGPAAHPRPARQRHSPRDLPVRRPSPADRRGSGISGRCGCAGRCGRPRSPSSRASGDRCAGRRARRRWCRPARCGRTGPGSEGRPDPPSRGCGGGRRGLGPRAAHFGSACRLTTRVEPHTRSARVHWVSSAAARWPASGSWSGSCLPDRRRRRRWTLPASGSGRPC